jgi:lipopolysaccharide transport system ATP-binding protein
MSYAIRFEGVSKRYLHGGPRYASFRGDLAEGTRRLKARMRGQMLEPRGRLALDDVTFDIPLGDSYALVGPNGAGKTTGLKLVSRISYPTGGRIRVRGRVGALIEVGSGVHPELTARENIWLYGQILGMSRREIRDRFDQIVDFAELAHALDTPVKMYSWGMQVRLGFGIASHLDPEIFLVDEALAVGDAIFQAKCVERMNKLVAEGRTLLFVSHDLAAVETVCRHGVFILNGKVHIEGEIGDVIRSYLDWVDTTHQAQLTEEMILSPSRFLELQSVTCHGTDGAERYAFQTGEDLEVRVKFRALRELRRPQVSIGITDGRAGSLIMCSMIADGGAPERVDGEAVISCVLENIPLLPRVYQLWCSVTSEAGAGDVFDWQPVGAFRIAGAPGTGGREARGHGSIDGPVGVAHRWRVEKS